MRGDAAKPTDGRLLRGARSHARIVQALYELVRDGNVQPTAEEVAKHAGVGTRTVFRQFDDVETLYRSLGERVQAEVLALADVTAPTGRLAEDVHTLVARRARLFEHMAPFRRAARLVRHTSPFLKEQEATLTAVLRAALLAIVGPHVRTGAVDTLEALDVLLSFEAWERLRDRQGLSRKQAERAVAGAALTLASAAAKRA